MRYPLFNHFCRVFHRIARSHGAYLLALHCLVQASWASPGDSLPATEPLPPAQTYFSVYAEDSTTGLPLPEATVNIRNPQAVYSQTSTDSRGWAYVSRAGLPASAFETAANSHWVSVGHPGYVSRMLTISSCASATTAPCNYRFPLVQATVTNSLTFAGTLINSATGEPLARRPIDLSHFWNGGWMTYYSATDDSGRFSITGIPITANKEGYLWVSPRRVADWIPVNLTVSGKPISVKLSNSVPVAREGKRVRAKVKSTPLLLDPSRSRDAAGRRRDR